MFRLYKISKFIHKWSSLIITLLLLWMGISGILLNHPEMISPISVSSAFIPDNYKIENWNRSSLSELKFSKINPKIAVIAGYEGIWHSTDGGYNFKPLNSGLPNSQYYRKSKSAYIIEDSSVHGYLAGTFGGLFYYDLSKKKWQNIQLDKKNEKVVKIIDFNGKIAVFTSSNAFVLNKDLKTISKLELKRDEKETSLTMLELFFQLHTGEIWGLPGKLLFDVAGIILIFLSLSGLYLWIAPNTSKVKLFVKEKSRILKWKGYKWFQKYHLKLGIYSVAVLLIIGITGFFMRPPAIVMIMDGEIPVKYIPGFKMENPWHDRIRNAMFDSVSNRLLIDAKDGFWVSSPGKHPLFRRQSPPVPIFAMGATVMQQEANGDYIIGSFSGLFRVSPESGRTIDALTGEAPYNISPVKPGSNLVTGYFKTPLGDEFITTHFGGLMPVYAPLGFNNRFGMHKELESDFTMSMWNYLFEIHNGRIFEFLVGDFYILIIPLSSLLFIISLVTGVFDWSYLKITSILHRKKRQKIDSSHLVNSDEIEHLIEK